MQFCVSPESLWVTKQKAVFFVNLRLLPGATCLWVPLKAQT